MVAPDHPYAPEAPTLGRYLVHVQRASRGELVEFSFAVNDDDLAVELVLPIEAFRSFCCTYRAALSVAGEARADLRRLAWRHGASELLHAAGAEEPRTGGES